MGGIWSSKEVQTEPEDESGELSFSAQTGHVGTSKHLLKKGEVDVKDKLPLHQALDHAAEERHLDDVKYLVEKCIQADKALDRAAEEGHLDVVKYLVEKCGQADKAALHQALRYAAEKGHLDVVKYLVENCGRVDEFGNLALILAVQGRNFDVMKYLVENGGQVDKERMAFRVAADTKPIDVVKYLVEKGAEVNAKDLDGETALGMAASSGHVDIVKYLIENGAEVNAVNKWSKPALHMAASAGHVDIVKYLVENGAEVNAADWWGETALRMAVSSGHVDIVKCLVENGAEVNAVDKVGKTALRVAASSGHVDIVKCLVENGAEVNAADEWGETALRMAVSSGHVDIVKCLVENGAEVNAVDKVGKTALRVAASSGHVDIVKCLVENGAEVNAADEWGETALRMAVSSGHVDIVKCLVENGAEVNAVDKWSKTALHMAASAGHVDIVKYLVENGAEVNAADWVGKTALRVAASSGHVDIVKCLVENGAEVNAADELGETALHMAAKAGHVDIVKYLIENGSKVSAVDKDGQTALHLAAEIGGVDVVKFLVQNGAQLDAKDKNGQLAFDLADDETIVNYLKDEQAKLLDAKNKISKARSLALQFKHPCCIGVVPYQNYGEDNNFLTMCVYVDSDDKGIPDDIKDEAEKEFTGYDIKYKDLQQPCRGIVTELPSSKKQNKEELLDLSRKIEENLWVFEKRVNVTAVGASYKVKDLNEKEIPCVTVFVLDKGRIPAGETDIREIKENYGVRFGNAEFDVVEGYFKLTNSDKPLNASYASPLRGGVGIGVCGSDRAGTLGGFLEDEGGKCYILSNEHVLNPLKRKDCTNEVVKVTGTSEQLSKDVKGVGYNHLSTKYGSDVDVENSISSEIIIEQPSQSDYASMVADASENLAIRKRGREAIRTNITQREQKGMSVTHLNKQMRVKELEIAEAETTLKKIQKGKPREVGRYLCGLRQNVSPHGQNCKFFVDAAIAELREDECELMKFSNNPCSLYGFVNKDDFNPNGEIANVKKFAEILRKEERKFVKFGRTTEFTNKGFVPESNLKLFVQLRSSDLQPPDSNFPLFHAQHLYCKECENSCDIDKETSNEISGNILKEFCCTKCGKPLSRKKKNDLQGDAESNDVRDNVKDDAKDNVKDDIKNDAQDDVKNDVKDEVNDYAKDEVKDDVKDDVKDRALSYWTHNCFVVRKNKKPFHEPGDSGAIVFGNKGLAWGLAFGTFKHPLKNTDYCLASPLSVALEALERKSGIKGLKLWCVKPAPNGAEDGELTQVS